MQKRITSIKLNNYRAYYDKYEPLTLSKGENLLVYGENGSGKSSLYKALNNYFASSNNPGLAFIKNRYNHNVEGDITIEFSDLDNISNAILPGTNLEYYFSSIATNTNVPFIQTAALVKGFLDYTDLLKVYLHQEPEPNLFKLIVLSLLGEHIPVGTGGTFRFGKKWNQLQDNLIKTFNRNTWDHRNAKNELPIYETHLRGTLNQIFVELNRLLGIYFSNLHIQLAYNLLPLDFHYGAKWAWYTTADLRLEVIKDGIAITGDFSDYLNEARLSAIAVCLYLASLRCNPSAVELKILFLDDVFIGLDAGNRLPILKILQTEFNDYQKFISTYDRHWFELAKKHFAIYNDPNWLTLEIYVGQQDINGGISITKPIIVKGESNFERAIQYLHNNSRPDYPASANYFRKALEELISTYMPKYELADSESVQIAEYKLGKLISKSEKFLSKTGNPTSDVTTIMGFLNVLLHPLSHHEISSPIYKDELILLEKAFYNLRQQFIDLDAISKYKCVLEVKSKIKVTLTINPVTDHHLYYEIVLEENLISQIPAATPALIFPCACYTTIMYGTNNGVALNPFSPNKNDLRFNYSSVEHACNEILNFGKTIEPSLTMAANYQTLCEYHDGSNWVSLVSRLV
jgi:energy-coupling factor transporter ATP-binding protein EcfA2